MAEILSRLVRAAHINATPRQEIVIARPDELAALAALYGLPGILMLQGRFTLRAESPHAIAAQLHITARLSQTCVITLEDFTAEIDEQVPLRFIPASSQGEGAEFGEAVLDMAALEGPDEITYTNGLIDLGSALAEQLALSLDPYPHRPGALLPAAPDEPVASPFAKLRGRPR